MKPPLLTRRSLIVFGLTSASPMAQAEEVAPADAKRIQAIVRDQLAAFAADDAKRAFGFASVALQRQFGSADRFMAMVRSAYPVVIRPASVAFLRPELVEGQWTQGVHLTDNAGARWLAVYRMERGAGGKLWRIGGCTLVPASGHIAGATFTSTARA
ncbi:MAG: DUF4864 domain-containing protein [Burkholderiaceae bacterium]